MDPGSHQMVESSYSHTTHKSLILRSENNLLSIRQLNRKKKMKEEHKIHKGGNPCGQTRRDAQSQT